MEGFLNRGWGPIIPGCGGIAGFLEGRLPPRAPRPLIGRGRPVRPPRPMDLENAGSKVFFFAYCITYTRSLRDAPDLESRGYRKLKRGNTGVPSYM